MPERCESSRTGGLSWAADYVAQLSPDEKTLDLNGWVTLGVRAAKYTADRFDTNTMKVWTYLELRF